MSALVALDAVSFTLPDGRSLFDGISLAFGRERTGLVGRNGVGKTTVLRLILGEVAPLAGAVSVSGRIGVLRQTMTPRADWTVADLLGAREDFERLARIEAGAARAGGIEAADWT